MGTDNNNMLAKDQDEETYSSIILNSFKDNIAVLDNEGTVVFINNGWREFGESLSGNVVKDITVGMNFSRLYERYTATPCIAYDILDGIKSVMECRIKEFTLEYSKPSKDDNKCFLFRACRARGNDNYIIVSHMEITDRKRLETALKEIEERTKLLFNKTDTIMLIIDLSAGKIIEANPAACRFYGYSANELAEKSILNINAADEKVLEEKMQQALEGKYITFEGRHRLKTGEIRDIEAYGSPIKIDGDIILYAIIHDVTDQKIAERLLKNSIKRAAEIQSHCLKAEFPLKSRADLRSLYMPAQELSGDFFRFIKINEDVVIAIIGDVAGKGIEAALSVNGVRMLFGESTFIYKEPLQILRYLNGKIPEHMEDEYVAACCFKLDFKKKQAVIAGAGINEFLYRKKGADPDLFVVKGAFLGMFEASEFEEHTIQFDSGDCFCFYTDGLENLFNEIKSGGRIHMSRTIVDFNNLIKNELKKQLPLRDDCTMLTIEII